MNDGVHPLKNEKGPSILYILSMTWMAEVAVFADIMRVLITSTGEHTVVATNP